jgi:predicted membrane protein
VVRLDGVGIAWNVLVVMHSISHSGMKIFDHPIESTFGGIEIDLATAPITPGEHRLEISGTVGGIEIYLPQYVTFTVEGGAAIGGFDVHDGPGIWNKLIAKLGSNVPVRAVDRPDESKSTSIHFVIDGGIGGIDIYRL